MAWKSDTTCETTNDSFIFTFKNINNYILSRVKDKNKAIVNGNLSLSFGGGDLDIFLNLGSCRCNKTSYEFPIRKRGFFNIFNFEECEVFQIRLCLDNLDFVI